MAEIRMASSGGNYQIVVWNFGAVRQLHELFFFIEAGSLAKNNLNIFCVVQYPANRRSDLAGTQHRGRYLVQKRLKCVVVLFVDQSDIDRLVFEGLRRPQSAESAPDYDYFWVGFHNISSTLTRRIHGLNIIFLPLRSLRDLHETISRKARKARKGKPKSFTSRQISNKAFSQPKHHPFL